MDVCFSYEYDPDSYVELRLSLQQYLTVFRV